MLQSLVYSKSLRVFNVLNIIMCIHEHDGFFNFKTFVVYVLYGNRRYSSIFTSKPVALCVCVCVCVCVSTLKEGRHSSHELASPPQSPLTKDHLYPCPPNPHQNARTNLTLTQRQHQGHQCQRRHCVFSDVDDV